MKSKKSFTCKCFLEWQHDGISWILSDGDNNIYLLMKVERFEGLFVLKVVCLFVLFEQFCRKSCGLWHLCNVNWIVSSITIYNMWQLMWHIVHKNVCNLTLINGTYCAIKKSFSWIFCVIKKPLSLLIVLCDSFMEAYQFFENFRKKLKPRFSYYCENSQ